METRGMIHLDEVAKRANRDHNALSHFMYVPGED